MTKSDAMQCHRPQGLAHLSCVEVQQQFPHQVHGSSNDMMFENAAITHHVGAGVLSQSASLRKTHLRRNATQLPGLVDLQQQHLQQQQMQQQQQCCQQQDLRPVQAQYQQHGDSQGSFPQQLHASLDTSWHVPGLPGLCSDAKAPIESRMAGVSPASAEAAMQAQASILQDMLLQQQEQQQQLHQYCLQHQQQHQFQHQEQQQQQFHQAVAATVETGKKGLYWEQEQQVERQMAAMPLGQLSFESQLGPTTYADWHNPATGGQFQMPMEPNQQAIISSNAATQGQPRGSSARWPESTPLSMLAGPGGENCLGPFSLPLRKANSGVPMVALPPPTPEDQRSWCADVSAGTGDTRPGTPTTFPAGSDAPLFPQATLLAAMGDAPGGPRAHWEEVGPSPLACAGPLPRQASGISSTAGRDTQAGGDSQAAGELGPSKGLLTEGLRLGETAEAETVELQPSLSSDAVQILSDTPGADTAEDVLVLSAMVETDEALPAVSDSAFEMPEELLPSGQEPPTAEVSTCDSMGRGSGHGWARCGGSREEAGGRRREEAATGKPAGKAQGAVIAGSSGKIGEGLLQSVLHIVGLKSTKGARAGSTRSTGKRREETAPRAAPLETQGKDRRVVNHTGGSSPGMHQGHTDTAGAASWTPVASSSRRQSRFKPSNPPDPSTQEPGSASGSEAPGCAQTVTETVAVAGTGTGTGTGAGAGVEWGGVVARRPSFPSQAGEASEEFRKPPLPVPVLLPPKAEAAPETEAGAGAGVGVGREGGAVLVHGQGQGKDSKLLWAPRSPLRGQLKRQISQALRCMGQVCLRYTVASLCAGDGATGVPSRLSMAPLWQIGLSIRESYPPPTATAESTVEG